MSTLGLSILLGITNQLTTTIMKKFKQEWSNEDHAKVDSALVNYFGGKRFKNHRGEMVRIGGTIEQVESVLGLPYTSSYNAMLSLSCNVHLSHPTETSFHYSYVVMSEDGMVWLVLWNEVEWEMFIPIACADQE